MKKWHTWIAEPRDPLIVRDGRPFSADIAGARASSLSFPFPSTLIGSVRTKHGQDNNRDFMDVTVIADLKRIAIRGPLLAELEDNGDIKTWLTHAPADILILQLKPPDLKKARIKRLVPLEGVDPQMTDFGKDQGDPKLMPVGLPDRSLGKAHDKAPHFWKWEKLAQWLRDPDSAITNEIELAQLGVNGLAMDSRTHVRVKGDTLTADDGGLFQTRGLEFSQIERDENDDFVGYRRFALAIATNDKAILNEGLMTLGGERRLSYWRQSQSDFLNQTCPAEILNQIVATRTCRVVLLTPAHFVAGILPQWLCGKRCGATATLQGIAVNRAQVVSGWDFDITKANDTHKKQGGRPKKTRRLAPAGSVFFLKFEDSSNEKAIEAWIQDTWMQCVSDDSTDGDPEQDRNDGFGLAVLGVWKKKMEASDNE